MKKETIKDKVLKILRRDGSINNFDCVQGTHGFITLRLGAVIHQLKSENLIDLDEEKSGYIGETKNWKYVIKNKPKDVIVYRVGDKIVGTKTIW